MLYQVKQFAQDFEVEELLPEWVPSGNGDFLYVFFQKENLTTMEVVDYLTQTFHLQREEIGIAWLKDKMWITRQRISVSKSSLTKIWWQQLFIDELWKKVQILTISFHDIWLKVASNAWNKFKIFLRAKQPISSEIKSQIEYNVYNIREKWFPNCFGMQRFGKWKKNFFEAKERLNFLADKLEENGKLLTEDLPYHLRFMLQAYASMYFNEYVLNRWEKWLHLLQWDVVVDKYSSNWVNVAVYDSQKIYPFDYQKLKKEKSDYWIFMPEVLWKVLTMDSEKWFPTGPMLWWNLLVPCEWTKARVRDNQIFELAGFDESIQQVCKIYGLWWVRRVLFVRVFDLKFGWVWNDIALEFSLPTGSYATVMLAFVLEWIDELTLKDNSLVIPRISNN